MISAPIPANEAERLADVRALRLLDTPPEERFDRIVSLAAAVFDVPIAYIALVDSDRQWFKAQCGLTMGQTGRDVSFCGHTILHDEPLVIPDARQDVRFADNPLVVRPPQIRFYAGHPLRGPNGHKVGTLCIASSVPRTLDKAALRRFRQFAALAEHELGMIDLIAVQQQLLEVKTRLVETQARLDDEMTRAAQFVRSLLPRPLAGAIRTEWEFQSSSKLGGDLLGYHWIDGGHLAIYLLDVCGHGVSAALLSISIFNDLRRQTLPHTDFRNPPAVLAALNRAFPMGEHGQKFTTVWYGVYHAPSRTLRHATAGHPPALLLEPGSAQPEAVGVPDIPIGIDPAAAYEGGSRTLAPGSRLYVYSDGVYEVPVGPAGPAGRGQLLMLHGLIQVLGRCVRAGGSRTGCVRQRIQALSGTPAFADDFSLLEVEFT